MNERREFHLEPKRFRLFVKDMDGETETFVDYENITERTRTITRQDGRVYIAAISFGIFGLAGVILNLLGSDSLMRWAPLWLIASIILWGFHFFKRRRYFLVDMHNKQSIFFIVNRPSKEALSRFIKELYATRRAYLRESYFSINPTNTVESELKKFQWLCKENVITEAELQNVKSLLLNNITSSAQQSKETPVQ